MNLVSWGHWSITFYVGKDLHSRDAESFFGELPFPVGAQGPMDSGPYLRPRLTKAVQQWYAGECPDGAMCYLDKKWLYVKPAKVAA